VITLTPFANTSCDPLADEGEISVKVADATAVPGPHTFTYAWNAGNPLALGTTLLNDGDADGTDGDGDNPGTLKEGTYQVTITNDQSFCASTASTTLFKNSTPVFTQQVLATNQVLCGNDGSLTVTEVKLIDRTGTVQSNATGDFPLTDFQFNWTKPAVAFAQTTAGPALNVGNYPAISFGEYYVSAERITGAPGAKCQSTPFKVDILDRRIFPVGTLTPFANTSCDPAFPEGAISVKVSDGTTVPGPFTYTYAWDNVGNPTPIATLNPGVNDGDAVSTDGDEDEPTNLLHGDYTVTIRNNQSGCQSNATTTIFKNATPIFIPQATATPQILCSADGSIEVNAVSLTDRTGTTQTASLAEFDFGWSRATLANQVATTQGLNGAVAGGTILDRTIYNQIGFDTYYIVATRVTGNVGRGCASAPFRTDILDKRVFPEVTVATIPNSSCNVALPNGSVTINASEPNGTNAGPYTFAWGLNGGSVSSASVQTDTNNSSVLSNALDGNYVVTATNTITSCPVNRPLLVLLDQTRSTPNIIDVTTVDPLDCNPTGSATVTKITLGSTTNSSLFPPNVPPNNEVTGAGLLNFNYEWYKDSFGAGNQLPLGGPPFTTTPNINSLVVGTYFVLVHDPSTDCRSGLREVVIKPDNVIYPVLDVVQTAKQVGCLTTTGSAELAATADGQTSANPNYAFTWFNNPDNTPPTIGSTSTISNLLAGTYSVTVRDNTTACTASAAYIITDDTEEFRPVVSMGSQPRTLCVGTDGAIVARVINVDPSYPFPYDNTTFTADLYVGATPNLGAAPDVPNISLMSGFIANFMESGLNEGFYTVRITDNNTGCVGIGTEEIKDTRKYPVLAVEEIAPMTNCDPARPNGVAQATANGTFVGFQFDWYEGSTVSGTPVYTGAEYGQIKALPQIYVVRATDINSGCTSDLATSVKDATVPIPAPTIEVLSHVTSCLIDNGALGSYVGVDRNTKDYVFNWYDGTSENPPADYVGEIYTNLAKGNYSVTATSIVTGCKSPLVTGEVLIKQEFPDFNFYVQNSSCDKSDGYASLILVSDVPIETIEWSNEVGPFLIGPNFTDAAAGVYTVTATSFLGCVTTKEVEILPDIHAYNGISRNNDGRNEIFQIDCIQNFPSNIVKIFNRAGTLVYEAEGYDNSTTFFDGKSNRGLSPMGVNLPDGTYFYIVDKRDGSKPLAGYLEIVK
jgi:gliding motility-associated-like protein